MTTMTGRLIVVALCLQTFYFGLLEAAKQRVQLSDSYLPVAMQVIAHLTDQMAFEIKEEQSGYKPPPKPTTKPVTSTPRPLYVTSDYFGALRPRSVRWWMSYGISRDVTTPFHRPGYYAPLAPPKPSDRINAQKQQQFNVPMQNQQQYKIEPQNQQQFNIQPQNQQQFNIQPQNQQQYNIPPQNQQQYNIPPQNQQQYNTPPQNQQQYEIPSQNQQNYNIPPQNEQQYNILPQNQQQYSTQPENQQQYSTQPENQQQYNTPIQDQQQYYIQSQNEQQYNIPTQNQQQYDIPQQHLQQYNIPLQNQQQYNFPQQIPQQYNVPPENQPFNVTHNQQSNFYSQQYNPLLQNQQYPAQQNQQYGVMTFDFPQYNPIQPQSVRSEEPLLSVHHDEVKPLLEPTPDAPHLLPPHFESDVDKISSRSKGFDLDEMSEENLQYLSKNVRDMIRMAYDPNDDRLVDVWEGLRAYPAEPSSKGKLSSSNLRLLLLYDLLSREAKRQRLSDYSGFSPDVMKTLVESSSGGARAQLSLALSKMVERNDCGHEYANNRAKEMVVELGKDESKLSSEIRYLQPLVYKY